jgi:ligand-binding sensor domain-containing protein
MPSAFKNGKLKAFFISYMKNRINAFTIFVIQYTMMKNYFLAFLFLGLSQIGFSQNQLWKGYFSFNEIKDLSQSANTIYAAAENALFSKNLGTNTLKTTTTIDGLSGQTITALYHSDGQNKTMVGYQNGLIIIINDVDGSMLNVVDIINKQIPSNIKKVNHFMEYNGIVYVSCDFGIVQYNLMTLQFGDTYFIGDNGDEIIVSQTAVYNGNLYAATSSGLRSASVTNPNLIDFNQWTVTTTGVWLGAETYGNELIVVNNGATVYRYNGNAFTLLVQLALPAVDLRTSGDYLVLTTSEKVYVYGQALTTVAQVDSNLIPDMEAVFTCATTVGDAIFIGTFENGVVTATIGNPSAFEFISPSGPVRNNIFSLNKESSNLWVVYGGHSEDYTPLMHRYGISRYNSSGWTNIPYSETHPSDREAYDFVRVTVNPSNESQIYVSSYHSGLLEFNDTDLVQMYDQTNSGLESLFLPQQPSYVSVRIEQSAFDRAGNLWMTNSLIDDPLKVLKTDGTWQSYNMEGILSSNDARTGRLVIDKNGTKWMCTTSDGVVAFNENGNPTFKKITFGPDSGNLQVADARAIAIDKRNQLWIGTRSGLSVLSSVDRFQTQGQMKVNPVIIEENNVATPLLYEQFITDIAVDGANNKWIGTADSGVFQVSSDGQETFHIFTSSNSPLPSNTINDIDIDGATGEVFIATSKGMVSFKGTSTDASGNLNNVVVYPNPVRPEFIGTVKITGLMDKAHVKIADITGSLVYETVTEGGTIEWDTTAFGKYKVASGVYMIFVSSEDGAETKVKKVMIIR